jgi:hypothetical protein
MVRHSQADVLAELRREMRMRENVFPRWVAAGKMTQDDADLKLQLMSQAVEDLITFYHGAQERLL